MRALPLADPRIVAVGDNVVDCYTADGVMYPGGNCVNVSVYAAREGIATTYIGAVADDAAGRLLRSSLVAEGVDVSRLRTEEGWTAYCRIGLVDGDRVFLHSGKGVSLFTPSEADLAAVADADALHVGVSSFLDEHLSAFAERTRISYDFSSDVDPAAVAPVARHCFLASFSAGGRSDEEVEGLLAAALSAGAVWVLVTRGERGALLSDGTERATSTPVATRVVDTLGAGDTFIARTLIGLLRGEPLDELMAAASVAAAFTCTEHGAFGYGAPIDITEHAGTPAP
ncbi:PfkB family carbohydrate kinase [Rathayibacter sp. VKM Ac-2927]|uniref:PfkB family carbohydrate kinase n=1 Tax=Rathayibacter sp. VKM Ac-2927 TaxID=2929478 RepID=UPI001FB1D640|nr:PfkB family carbohydrate kinase [Rathayibacter sp. VKM Ac-2927]MCJ1686994.1 PfkB family carbohydrate kinase [Rathayibacter sp. VKM Ac-2927]